MNLNILFRNKIITNKNDIQTYIFIFSYNQRKVILLIIIILTNKLQFNKQLEKNKK